MQYSSFSDANPIPIEFRLPETFATLPRPGRLKLTLVTSGNTSLVIDDSQKTLKSPCIFL